MDKISIEEIRGWLKSPITREFFRIIKDLREDCDKEVHKNLAANTPNDLMNKDSLYHLAALQNAGLDQLKEVENIPGDMIDGIKEEQEEKKKNT